ncbi:MAG: acyl-CoA thioesterase [Candidatus Eisenbacteria bacterium]
MDFVTFHFAPSSSTTIMSEPDSIPPPPHQPYEHTLEVRPEDIDVLGHVNNVVYLRWVQDIAVAHWRVLATPAQQKAIVWVVVRHEIDYKHAATAGDTILARTWVGTATRRTFQRHTEILRASDGRLLARARTLWCPLDPETHRPMAVDDDVRARFSVPSSGEG